MYVAIEKLEHSPARPLGEPTRFRTLAKQDAEEAAQVWRDRGYILYADLSTKAVIILDKTRAIGVIQLVKVHAKA